MPSTKEVALQLDTVNQILDTDTEKALKVLQTIFEQVPQDSAVQIFHFLAFHKLGKRNEIQIKTIQQLLSQLSNTTFPKIRLVECHFILGRELREQGILEAAALEFKQALGFAQELQQPRLIAEAMNLTASVLVIEGQQQQAIWYLKSALAIPEIGTYKANVLINLGSAYRKLGKIEQAVEYIQAAYNILVQTSDTRAFINCLLSLAQLNNELRNFEEALVLTQQAFDKAQTTQQSPQVMIAILNTWGYIHLSAQNWSDAQPFFLEALEKAQDAQFPQFEIDNLDGLGQVYTALGRYQEALKVHQEALQIAKTIGHREGMVDALLNLGRDYLALNNPLQALIELELGLEIAKQSEHTRSIFEAHLLLSKTHKRLDNYAKALDHHELFYEIQRQVYNTDSEEKTRLLLVQFDVERAQQSAQSAQEARILAEVEVEKRTAELKQTQLEVLQRLAIAAEYRDDQTGQHTQRVGQISAAVATQMGWLNPELEILAQAAKLHDIGKIGIPDAVLNKPGKYLESEYAIMKTHTIIGAKILSGGDSRLVQMAEQIASSHHERWDGTGYPNGLRGEEIPMVARIVAVVDVFDALISERPYKDAWTRDAALTELQRCSGTHFDPEVIDAFMAITPKLGKDF